MLANDQASQQNLEVAHSQMLWLDGLMAEQGSDFIAGDRDYSASMAPTVAGEYTIDFSLQMPGAVTAENVPVHTATIVVVPSAPSAPYVA